METLIRVMTDSDAEKCCSMSDAIDAMQIAFTQLSSGEAVVPVRTNLRATDHTESLIMPVAIPNTRFFGLKAVSLTDDNTARNLPRIHAAVLLFDSTTGQPTGLINGEHLTALRTGAASGLASKILASESASHLVIFGTGRQAKYQILGVINVRPILKVTVVSRDLQRAQMFCSDLEIGQEIKLEPTTDTDVVAEADVICTATSSATPLFDVDLIGVDCHVNAIGSYRSDMTELPPSDLPKFKVVVDQRQGCLKESGEIVQAIEFGHLMVEDLIELGELDHSNNQYRGRRTLFKSVGNAAQDLVVAELILQKAILEQIGAVVYF